MTQTLKTLNVVDLDGHLIKGSESLILPPFFREVFKYMQPDLGFTDEDFPEFDRQGNIHYHAHGCSVRGFREQLGKDDDWLIAAYQYPVQHMLAATAHIEPDAEMIAKAMFLKTERNHHFVVNTQGTNGYAKAQLAKHGLLNTLIMENDVHGIEDVKGALKRDENSYAFKRMEEEYPKDKYPRRLFSDDTAYNVVISKRDFDYDGAFHQGPKAPLEEHLPYIDHRHADIHGTLNTMLELY